MIYSLLGSVSSFKNCWLGGAPLPSLLLQKCVYSGHNISFLLPRVDMRPHVEGHETEKDYDLNGENLENGTWRVKKKRKTKTWSILKV